MKNFLKNFKKGFTLIELLVVISIILLLASIIIVTIGQTRIEARAGATKTTLSGLRSAIVLCCENIANSLTTTPGGDICSQPPGVLLPTAPQLHANTVEYGAYETGSLSCTHSNPGYNVTLTGHPKSACNATWRVSAGTFTPPPGC